MTEQIKKMSGRSIKVPVSGYIAVKQRLNGTCLTILFMFHLTFLTSVSFAQKGDSSKSNILLKKMSLEELMNIEVTSVSMRPEKLTEVASAIQVITSEDIRRSSALRLPEALRLASNLQMAQVNSHDWSITARGMSGLPTAGGILSNKLLVTMDGRSLYSPLFGGVYWDVQNMLLFNVDRIEVVSGPGGTLWGANAVNGIINIVSKSARETQGVYVSTTGGSYLQDRIEMQYGGRIGSKLFYRVYRQRFDQDKTSPTDTVNQWNAKQGGFRMDYYPSQKGTYTLQGDFYNGWEKKGSKYATTNGQNILGRYTYAFSDSSDLKIRVYFDRTDRKTPKARTPFNYELNTYDIDIQHRFSIGNRLSILWGGGYRLMQDLTNSAALSPRNRTMTLFTGFVQEETAIIPNKLKLTIGSKFQHNVFTGVEIQPSARLAIMPNANHTIWTAVSRAVRTPSRFDSDIITATGVKLTPVQFKSEKVIAYELGYRVKPMDILSLSIATFYNQYTDLRSLNTSTNPGTPTIIANDQTAASWGIELSGLCQVLDWWRLRAGYSTFKKKTSSTNSTVLPLSANFEGVDPEYQFTFQSMMNLPKNFSLDLSGRYVSIRKSLPPTPTSPAYFTFDARLAYQFKHFEISIVGQNLIHTEHNEIGVYTIPRSVYGKLIYHI